MISQETSTYAQNVNLTSPIFGPIQAFVLEIHALMVHFKMATRLMKTDILNVWLVSNLANLVQIDRYVPSVMLEVHGHIYSEKPALKNVLLIKLQLVVSVLHVDYLAELVNLTHQIVVRLARIQISYFCLDINVLQPVRMGLLKINQFQVILNVMDARLVANNVIKETTQFVLLANLVYHYLIVLVDQNVLPNTKKVQMVPPVNSELIL